jgi:hypothetical protein
MNRGLHFPLLTALTVEVCLIGGLLGETKPAGDAENGMDKENALRTKYDAYLKADQFLAALGYIPLPKQRN